VEVNMKIKVDKLMVGILMILAGIFMIVGGITENRLFYMLAAITVIITGLIKIAKLKNI